MISDLENKLQKKNNIQFEKNLKRCITNKKKKGV